MMTLRCTEKLLTRIHLKSSDLATAHTPPPTTALGDWYGTLLFTRPQQFLLFVSERSRLPLLVPARDINALTAHFRSGVGELLREIGVSEASAKRELEEMDGLCYGLTRGPEAGRSVVGSMNDFSHAVKFLTQVDEWTPLDLSVELCDTPCGPLRMRSPREVTRELLEER